MIFFFDILTKEGHLDEDCQGAGKADQESPMGLIPEAKTHPVVCKKKIQGLGKISGTIVNRQKLILSLFAKLCWCTPLKDGNERFDLPPCLKK